MLLTPLRAVGDKKVLKIIDLVFECNSYHLVEYVTAQGRIDSADVVLRGGVFLLCGNIHKNDNKKAQDENCVLYSTLLQKKIYDEEGELLGEVGEIEVDLQQRKIAAVELSDGIWMDLWFGRRRLDMVHLEKMQKEWEEWE